MRPSTHSLHSCNSTINSTIIQLPGTTYSCYQFVPYAGTAQLHVSKEWALGRMFLNALQHTSSLQQRVRNFRHISSRIESHSTDVIGMRVIDMALGTCHWYPNKSLVIGIQTDLNLDLDRFEHFKEISSPLVCFSSHKVHLYLS